MPSASAGSSRARDTGSSLEAGAARLASQAVGARNRLSASSTEVGAARLASQAVGTRKAAIDVATHIVAEDTAKVPEDYGSTFMLLGAARILDEDLAARLRSAAGLRDLLVHGYADVDPDRMWASVDELDDLVAFAVATAAYL